MSRARKYIKKAKSYWDKYKKIKDRLKGKRKRRYKESISDYMVATMYYQQPMMAKERIEEYLQNLMASGMSREDATIMLHNTIPSTRIIT